MTGTRSARANWPRLLLARASSRSFPTFVVPDDGIARAAGLDLPGAGLTTVATPRHARVLLLVGHPPDKLEQAAAVVYSQMPRPRALVTVGNSVLRRLPPPHVTATCSQEGLQAAVTALSTFFAKQAFGPHTTEFGVDAMRTETEYACPMHPDVVRPEPGSCPICGMDLVPRKAEGGHGGHQPGRKPGHDAGSRGRDQGGMAGHDHDPAADRPPPYGASEPPSQAGTANDAGHAGGFMSMVAMTRDLPRSEDGLPMEWVEVPFGPLFPGLPGGLMLTLTLDGDGVADAKAVPGAALRNLAASLAGDREALPAGLWNFDRLAPGAYGVLAWQALAAGDDEATQRARIGTLEWSRALSHLGWLAAFGYLLGHRWLREQAAELQLSLVRAEQLSAVTPIHKRAECLAERVERNRALRRRLEGIGVIQKDVAGLLGPVARAAGQTADGRLEDPAYRGLGFQPETKSGGDALARLQVRLGEIIQSLRLVQSAGTFRLPATPPPAPGDDGEAWTALELPRGRATAQVAVNGGRVSSVHVTAPSSAHLALVPQVAVGAELADALVAVASLDISPWEVDQ